MSNNEFIDKEELDAKKALKEAKKKTWAERSPLSLSKGSRSQSSKRKKRANKKDQDSRRVLVQLMNGEFLSKDNFIGNLPFTFFIGFLLVVMIGWGYYAETVTKHEVKLEKELGELNSEFFTLGSEYNSKRGRRPIAEKLVGTGVKESLSSPKKIRVRKYQFE